MPASGLGTVVVLTAAVLCGPVSEGEPLRTGTSEEHLQQSRPAETQHWEEETRYDREETRDGSRDRSETRPVRLVSERGVTDAGLDSSLSDTVYHSLRLKRTPLRISRIGQYRAEASGAAPIGGTNRYQPENVSSAEDSELDGPQHSGEGPTVTAVTELPSTGSVWKPNATDKSDSHQQDIKTEPASLAGVKHQPESSRSELGVSTSETDDQSRQETDNWLDISPELDGVNGNRAADAPTASDSSELTERLQGINSRIQLVRQKLSQRLSSEMR